MPSLPFHIQGYLTFCRRSEYSIYTDIPPWHIPVCPYHLLERVVSILRSSVHVLLAARQAKLRLHGSPLLSEKRQNENGKTTEITRWHGVHPNKKILASAVAPNTLRAYSRCLVDLSAWLGDRSIDDVLLAEYLTHLHETGKSPSTIGQVVAAVKWRAKYSGKSDLELTLTNGYR
ncbi:hypothetical protein F4X73_15130 [Candidatus Poribacteria bacterium]|nr:hypothetical protein [Candidatus Poribacteria bacterium]MYB66022.1 hypothetical protein [Candidatus Poribacteria bacterium]MYF56478.1 hypothetical protein [Candidatus Poribacteria bacterium]